MYNCPLHWPLFRFAQNFDVMRNSMLLRKNAKNKIEFLGKKTLKNKTLSCKFFSFIYLYPEKKKKIVFIFFNLCNKYTREYYCTYVIAKFFQGGIGPKWKFGRKIFRAPLARKKRGSQIFRLRRAFFVVEALKTAKKPLQNR